MSPDAADVNAINPEPLMVEDTNAVPRDVRIVGQRDTDQQATARVVAAAAQVDADVLRTDDQRRISGMWERTQQIIALSVVEVTLFVAGAKSLEPLLRGAGADATTAGVAFVFLASVSNLVIGFYFGRTNHQRVGGAATSLEDGRGR